MTEDANILACQQFQARLPDLIESGASLEDDPHLRDCPLCRELIAELETIATAARDLFPVEEPPDKLWEHIEYAIQNEGGSREPEETKE